MEHKLDRRRKMLWIPRSTLIFGIQRQEPFAVRWVSFHDDDIEL